MSGDHFFSVCWLSPYGITAWSLCPLLIFFAQELREKQKLSETDKQPENNKKRDKKEGATKEDKEEEPNTKTETVIASGAKPEEEEYDPYASILCFHLLIDPSISLYVYTSSLPNKLLNAMMLFARFVCVLVASPCVCVEN